jgi:hypothetical protein
LARSRPIAVTRAPALVWRRHVVPLALWPILALLAFYVVLYVQFASQLASFPFDLDQGEGYDAWSGWLINLGQLPYTSNATYPYYSSNYPPLWSYLVSIPMAWVGPGLGAARVFSTLSALGTAVVLGLSARRMAAGSTLAGILAGGFFLASPYVFHTTPLARVNATALLLAVCGLWLMEEPTRKRVALASLAFLAALFTKQTTIDAVAAGVIWLVLRQRRLGIVAGSSIAALALIGLGGLVVVTGGAFWLNVVAGNANPMDGQQLSGYLLNFALLHCVLLAMAVAEALRVRINSPWPLYFVTASLATLSVAKWGAGESYFLGAIAAACVLAGSWAARHTRVTVCAALLLQLALLSHGAISEALGFLPDRGPQSVLLGRAPAAADRFEAEQLVRQLRRAQGPVMSEDASFAVAAGGAVIGNATHLRNLYQAGLWDPSPMVADLRARRYAIVVLNAELYPEPVLAAIGHSYFVDRAVHINGATYHVFLPGSD